MAKRIKLNSAAKGGGLYLPAPTNSVERIKSGCVLLDCALGGGWAKNHVINLVGDNSTGKTLLAIEMCANFAHQFPEGQIRYRDRESVFDVPYAQGVGFPVERAGPVDCEYDTVQAFAQDVEEFANTLKRNQPGLFVMDSLDALCDESEVDGDAGGYGTGKAKEMSRLFRRLIGKLKTKDVTLLVISQTRANIGVTFGERLTRTGGKALDFYAAQIVWLALVKKLFQTRNGVERSVGILTRAKVKKNKCGRPHREAEFPILYDYGVEDVWASAAWLYEVGYGTPHGLTSEKAVTKFAKDLGRMELEEYRSHRKQLSRATREAWATIEKDFSPKRRKYAL